MARLLVRWRKEVHCAVSLLLVFLFFVPVVVCSVIAARSGSGAAAPTPYGTACFALDEDLQKLAESGGPSVGCHRGERPDHACWTPIRAGNLHLPKSRAWGSGIVVDHRAHDNRTKNRKTSSSETAQ